MLARMPSLMGDSPQQPSAAVFGHQLRAEVLGSMMLSESLVARSSRVHVFVSSRNGTSTRFRGEEVTLTQVRRALKAALEATTVPGRTEALFEVYINEDEAAAPQDDDLWERCLRQARAAHIVLVIYTGDAGWAREPEGVGICHAELEAALAVGAGRVRILQLRSPGPEPGQRHHRFAEYVERLLPDMPVCSDGDDLMSRSLAAVGDALVHMVELGYREACRGRYDSGDALDWSRLNFDERSQAIAEGLRGALRGVGSPVVDDKPSAVILQLERHCVLFCCHGVPAALSESAAREMVGRPHLRDHVWLPEGNRNVVGPVHVIGCHKGATETQAVRMLGFPDATVVRTTFGVYVADIVQNVQLLLLKDCRDRTSTEHAVQRAWDWLRKTGELELLEDRAMRRGRIVREMQAAVSEVRSDPRSDA